MSEMLREAGYVRVGDYQYMSSQTVADLIAAGILTPAG